MSVDPGWITTDITICAELYMSSCSVTDLLCMDTLLWTGIWET